MNEGKNITSGFAIASLALGIMSFIQLAGYEKPILAIVFGVLALRRIGRMDELGGKKISIAGIILGIIGIIVTTVVLLIYFPHIAEQMGMSK